MLCIQLATIVVGSGILSLPYTLYTNGILIGLIIIMLLWLLSIITGIILIENIGKLGNNYTDSFSSLFGLVGENIDSVYKKFFYTKIVQYLALFGIVAQEFGALTSYIFLLIQTYSSTFSGKITTGLVLFIVLLILVTLDLSKISWISMTSMIIFFICKFSIMFDKSHVICTNSSSTNLENKDNPNFLNVFKAVTVCFFALSCHTSIGGLTCKNGNKKTRLHLIIAYIIILVLYIATSVCDMFTFPYIDPNIMDTFITCTKQDNIINLVIPHFFNIGIITTIPTLFISITNEFKNYDMVVIKACSIMCAIFIAILFETLVSILSFFGAINGLINMIIIPLLSFEFRSISSVNIFVI